MQGIGLVVAAAAITCRVQPIPGNLGQAQHRARSLRFGGVQPEVAVFTCGLGGLHGLVDTVDHHRRITPGVVAAQAVTAQAVHHKSLRGPEHLRFRAAEAVDALLRVTHHKDRRRLGATARAGIGAEPGMQRLPLQGAGVLELVDEQLPHPRVQPLLHPAAEHRVGQHGLCSQLHIVHVHPAPAALEAGELCHQAARQPRHTLLVVPGLLLVLCGHEAQHQVLRLANVFDTGHLVVELAWLALLRQQGVAGCLRLGSGDGLLQLHALGHKGFGAELPQGLGCGEQAGFLGGRPQPVHRRRGLCHVGKLHIPAFDRRIHHASGIRQCEFHPAHQGRREGFQGLRAAVAGHHSVEIGAQRFVVHQGGEEHGPDLGNGPAVVFQQLIPQGQAHPLQHRQRRGAQQGGKPAVEGADLHRPAFLQQALFQSAQGGIQARAVLLQHGVGHAACTQFTFEFCIGLLRKIVQPLVQPGAHFTCRLLGEGDGQDVIGNTAVEQRPHDA